MKQEEEFTNISDDEDEIHIVQSSEPTKPVVKRKKQESIFVQNLQMQHIQTTIIGYEKETFLKIQTQTYKIEVRNLRTDEMWIIKRRYSDVLWLHEALLVNHIGYISPFFPSKTLESFLTAKLGIHFGKDKKDDFINERTQLISNFLRSVYSNSDLKYAEQSTIFICKNDNDFMTQKKKIESYMQEYKDLETSSATFLSIVQKGSSLISNYLGGSKKLTRQITKQDIQFQTFESKVIQDENSLKKLSQNLQDLASLKIKQSQAAKLQGDWDKIQMLNSRVQQSRKHNIKLSSSIKQKVLKNLNHLICWVQEVHSQLTHRKQTIQFTFSLKQNIDDLSRIRKLERRIQKFENNFRKSYPSFKQELTKEQNLVSKAFKDSWEEYRQAMSKIWK